MANNGIEDILIGESYKSTKKNGGHPIIFLIILLMIAGAFGVWYYYTNRTIIDEKTQFANGILSASTIKLNDKNFYSTIFDRILQENSEMTTNMTVTTTEQIEQLQGIDINNFDFELTSQNNLKEKNFYGELFIKYSGNEFLKVQNIVNDNRFAVISDEIVNKYVGVQAQNFKKVFNSNIDLEFIYELINEEKISLSEEEKKSYIENYYNKIYNKLPSEKFSKKENIVITKNNNYIDVTAYEMSLSQSELNDIIVNVLTDIKNDEKLLNSVISKDTVELDLQNNPDESTNQQEELNQEDENIKNESVENELEVREGGETNLQLVPVSQVNFQTADEINIEGEESEEGNPQEQELENEENPTEQNVEDVQNEEVVRETIENPEGLSLETNEGENNTNVKNEFTTSDFIKLLLGRKINILKEKIVEKIDEYIENLEGNGIVVTVYVSDQKTEKISIILPNENKVDIQFIENTDKENSIELTYLNKESDYKDGIGINIDEVHNSANSSIKLVRNYIENEKVNEKISFSLQTDGTKNANSISNDIVITSSTNSDETKFVAENKIKFISDNLVLDKLTEENSVFLDDLSTGERDATIQAIKEKIDLVLEEKKQSMSLIDLNSGTSVVSSDLNNMTANNYPLVKAALQNRINTLRNEALENEQEFTLENLMDLTIDGFEVTTNIEEDRAIIVVDVYTFSVDKDFNVNDT